MSLARLIVRQVMARPSRIAAVGLSLIVALVSLSLLTAQVSAERIRLRHVISSNWRPDYDLLVRAQGSETVLERQRGLVQAGFLDDTSGGITVKQWHEISALSGVAVAAPIAVVGYVLLPTYTVLRLPDPPTSGGGRVYRIELGWRADSGLSTYTQSSDYLYWDPSGTIRAPDPATGHTQPLQVGPSGRPAVAVCRYNALSQGVDGSMFCQSGKETGSHPYTSLFGGKRHVQIVVTFTIPVLLAGIDPASEQELVGLGSSVTSGHYLGEHAGVSLFEANNAVGLRTVPVLASSTTYLDQKLVGTFEQLRLPTGLNLEALLASRAVMSRLDSAKATSERRTSVSAAAGYENLLHGVLARPERIALGAYKSESIDAYWSASAIHLEREGSAVKPVSVTPSKETLQAMLASQPGGVLPGATDKQFRHLTTHTAKSGCGPGCGAVSLQLAGTFDPSLLPGISPGSLSNVPIGAYFPPLLTGATQRSTQLLHSRPLGPTTNIGGFVGQPPLMLTTLTAARALLSAKDYSAIGQRGMISCLRVRVTGDTGPNGASEARVAAIADAIRAKTGLSVQVVDGASPTSVRVDLPAGYDGRPALVVSQPWARLGAALVVLRSLNPESLGLLLVLLLVVGMFTANVAVENLRTRRGEFAILRALGWTRNHLMAMVLGEFLTIAALSGLVASGVSALVLVLIGSNVHLLFVLALAPGAMVITMAVTIVPAITAATALPSVTFQPTVTVKRWRTITSVWRMAVAQAARRRGQTVLAASGLALGITAFAVVFAIAKSFQGDVGGTLLGSAVVLRSRGVDELTASFALLLGAAGISDAMFVAVRDQSHDLALLLATGWRRSDVLRLLIAQSAVISLVATTTGVALGTLILALISVPITLLVAGVMVVAGLAGVILATGASLALIRYAQRHAPAVVLAEDS